MVSSKIKTFLYTRIYTPLKAFHIRHKKRINVIFVVSELGCWKTELLYRQMLLHPRFEPHIAVSPLYGTKEDAVEDVIQYLTDKGYEFKVVSPDKRLSSYFPVRDIIFYQQPYNDAVCPSHRISKNLMSLFCYVGYSMNATINESCFSHALFSLAWQLYFDNKSVIDDLAMLMHREYPNAKVTGHTIGDEFLQPLDQLHNPWKNQPGSKKKIIWAPHHTLPDEQGWLNNSTFLSYYDFMLEMADKYCDNVQFAFKPHPMLRAKLEKRWGRIKTDEYYSEWQNRPNTQLEEGKYIGLFMHSDAMIHDCDSFIVEYQYSDNPALFCENGIDHRSALSTYAKEAYDLHYKAYTKEDMERFINDVISGNDSKKESREAFRKSNLLPPNGKSACENIIDAILGKRT